MMNSQEDKVQKLNLEFDKAFTAAKAINSEKRVNQSLYLGNHFQKVKEMVTRELEKSGVDKSTSIRITKNHIFKICEYIINNILQTGPTGMGIFPANENELQDQKAAELHSSVLEDWKYQSKFKKLVRSLVKDFVVDGEVCTKRFWNPNIGPIVGYEPVEDKEGNVSQRPIRSGDVEVERFFAWDLRLPEGCRSVEKAPWVGYEKIIPTKELQAMVPPELKDKIIDQEGEKFNLYDPITGGYDSATKGQTILREKYTRPCEKYPNGYFEFFNKNYLIHEGELPEGIPFPIKVCGYTEVPTSPRSISLLRQLRPLQTQVNYGASQQAIAQMTLGQDKLILLGGADLQYVGANKGVEKFKTNSLQSPTILPGRSGGQFVESMVQAITEMYSIANVPEMGEEKMNQSDPQTALFKSAKDKRRFSLVAERFTEYVQEMVEDVLQLKKMYMDDRAIVRAVGRAEQINIPEFKASENLGYQIRVSEVDEDASSQLGKHITLTNLLQYGGQGMSPEMIALIGRNMPFNNSEEIFSEALVDYDSVKNIILALDRGEQVQVMPNDNVDYLLPRINARTRKADFRFMAPEIQQAYQVFMQQLEQTKAAQLQQLKQQQSQMIPTTGAMVPIPIYREMPKADGGIKYERVQVPYDALEYLVGGMESQGIVLDPVKRMNQSVQAGIAEEFNGAQGAQPQVA